jgi:uncharacterized protein with FMN-binding domain
MKRITYALMSTLTALVLLFGYRTSTSSTAASYSTVAIGVSAPSTPSTSASSGQTTSSAGSPPTGTNASSSTTSGAAAAASTATVAKTITGTAAQTRYGPVQVQITVQSGKITNVSVIQYPNSNGRDQEINSNALPILVSETIKAQTAKVDMVSGATYTSNGYLTSLQSALDQAGL